jgi:hypothetical protein
MNRMGMFGLLEIMCPGDKMLRAVAEFFPLLKYI